MGATDGRSKPSEPPYGILPMWWVTTGRWATLKAAGASVGGVLVAHRNGRTGIATISIDTIAAESGLTRQGVLNGIAQLEAAGLIEVDRQTGRKHRNEYSIKRQPPLTILESQSANGDMGKAPTANRESANGATRKRQPPLTRTEGTEEQTPTEAPQSGGRGIAKGTGEQAPEAVAQAMKAAGCKASPDTVWREATAVGHDERSALATISRIVSTGGEGGAVVNALREPPRPAEPAGPVSSTTIETLGQGVIAKIAAHLEPLIEAHRKGDPMAAIRARNFYTERCGRDLRDHPRVIELMAAFPEEVTT